MLSDTVASSAFGVVASGVSVTPKSEVVVLTAAKFPLIAFVALMMLRKIAGVAARAKRLPCGANCKAPPCKLMVPAEMVGAVLDVTPRTSVPPV